MTHWENLPFSKQMFNLEHLVTRGDRSEYPAVWTPQFLSIILPVWPSSGPTSQDDVASPPSQQTLRLRSGKRLRKYKST